MDPQATLWELLAAYHNGNRQQVNDYLEYFQEWNKKGGFLPTVQGRHVTGVENMVYIVTSKSTAPKV
jgi:hypothetical protein